MWASDKRKRRELRTYIQRKIDLQYRRLCTSCFARAFLPRSRLATVSFCSINHPSKTSSLNERGLSTASLSFFKGYFLYSLTPLFLSPCASAAYQFTRMLHSLFFFLFSLSCNWGIALVPIILTTGKFERVCPKIVKPLQSYLVRSINWCQEWVTTCLDTGNLLEAILAVNKAHCTQKK